MAGAKITFAGKVFNYVAAACNNRITPSSRALQSTIEDIEHLKIEALTVTSCAMNPTKRS